MKFSTLTLLRKLARSAERERHAIVHEIIGSLSPCSASLDKMFYSYYICTVRNFAQHPSPSHKKMLEGIIQELEALERMLIADSCPEWQP